MSLLILGVVWGVAIAVSLAVTGMCVVAGLGDVPGERSSHSKVTPTAGGLGVLAGVGAGLLLLSMIGGSGFAGLAGLVALIFAMGLIGLYDDIFEIRAGLKFALILLPCALAVKLIGPVTVVPFGPADIELPRQVGFVGSVLWLFVVINAVNFMDGINGLIAGSMNAVFMVVAGFSLAFGASLTPVLAIVLSGGLIGFLPYNYKVSADVFSGDCGALPIGFAYGLLPLLLVREVSADLIYLGPLLILPLLTDVFVTLMRRVKRGENLMSAHRGHLYQLAARRHGHVAVSSVFILMVVPLAALVLVGVQTGLHRSLFALLLLSAVAAMSSWGLARRYELYERRSTT